MLMAVLSFCIPLAITSSSMKSTTIDFREEYSYFLLKRQTIGCRSHPQPPRPIFLTKSICENRFLQVAVLGGSPMKIDFRRQSASYPPMKILFF